MLIILGKYADNELIMIKKNSKMISMNSMVPLTWAMKMGNLQTWLKLVDHVLYINSFIKSEK